MRRREKEDVHPTLLSHLCEGEEEESDPYEMEELWPQQKKA